MPWISLYWWGPHGISGIKGIMAWESIKGFLETNLVGNFYVQGIFAIMIIIASLGGIALK